MQAERGKFRENGRGGPGERMRHEGRPDGQERPKLLPPPPGPQGDLEPGPGRGGPDSVEAPAGGQIQ